MDREDRDRNAVTDYGSRYCCVHPELRSGAWTEHFQAKVGVVVPIEVASWHACLELCMSLSIRKCTGFKTEKLSHRKEGDKEQKRECYLWSTKDLEVWNSPTSKQHNKLHFSVCRKTSRRGTPKWTPQRCRSRTTWSSSKTRVSLLSLRSLRAHTYFVLS